MFDSVCGLGEVGRETADFASRRNWLQEQENEEGYMMQLRNGRDLESNAL